jgi:hypothetical protein
MDRKQFVLEGVLHMRFRGDVFGAARTQLRRTGRKLSQAGDKIGPVRHKWVAHFEVEYDAALKEYVAGSVAHLTSLLKRLDIGTERSEAIAKQNCLCFLALTFSSPWLPLAITRHLAHHLRSRRKKKQQPYSICFFLLFAKRISSIDCVSNYGMTLFVFARWRDKRTITIS